MLLWAPPLLLVSTIYIGRYITIKCSLCQHLICHTDGTATDGRTCSKLDGLRWPHHGPLARYLILRVAHAPGMPGTFSPPPTSRVIASYRSRRASRHVRDARAVMHVGIDNPRWRGKCPRHSWRMRNPQFCVSGKMLIGYGAKLKQDIENSCVFLVHSVIREM